MRLLFDTHCALWAVFDERRFPDNIRAIVSDPDTDLAFSAVSIAEIGIKRARDRADFPYEPALVRNALLGAGYREIAVEGQHALLLRTMPLIHRDPFDRLLVAQAHVEAFTLLTADSKLLRYDVATLAM